MTNGPAPRRPYVPAVGPKLRRLLLLVFGLFALLAVNSVYLGSVTLLEWLRGATYQEKGGLTAKVGKLRTAAAAGWTLLRLYMIPAKTNALPRDIRLVPSW